MLYQSRLSYGLPREYDGSIYSAVVQEKHDGYLSRRDSDINGILSAKPAKTENHAVSAGLCHRYRCKITADQPPARSSFGQTHSVGLASDAALS